MLIVNLCNQGNIYKQDNNNDTFRGDSDDSDKNMLDVFICLVYITSWLTMLTISDWQMRGAFVGIFGAGSYSTGKLPSKCCVYFDAFCGYLPVLGLVGLYWDEGTWYFQWDFYWDSKRAFG